MPEDVPHRPSAPNPAPSPGHPRVSVSGTWFRDVIEHSAVGIAIADAEGRIYEANPAFGRMLGYATAELVGMSVVQYTHPDDRALVAQQLDRVLRGEVPAVRLEKRNLGRDGRVVWVDLTVTAVPPPEGGRPHLFGQSVDITDHKLAEMAAHVRDGRREALQRITAQALEAESLAEALPGIADSIAQATTFPVVVIALPEEGNFDVVTVQAASGFTPAVPLGAWRMPVARCLSGADLRTDPALQHLGTFVGVPMRLAGLVRGCLALGHPGKLTVDDAMHHWLADLADVLGLLVDRLTTAENLARKEALLQRISDLSPAHIYLFDVEQGRNIFANRAIAQMLGIDPMERAGAETKLPQIMHPDDLAQLPAHQARIAAAGDQPVAWEYRVRSHTDEWRWMHSWDLAFARTPDGRLRQVLGVAVDVTERRQSADRSAALARERDAALERLRLQFERLPLACIVTDAAERIVSCNPATERIFGFSPEALLGRNCLEVLVPAAERAEIQAHLVAASARGDTAPHVNDNLTKEGRRITCEWHNTALHDGAGRFIGFLFMARDITEERRAQAHVQAASDLLRKLSAQVPGMLFVFERYPDGRYALPFTSDALAEFYGLASNALAHDIAPLFAAIHPDDLLPLRASIEEACRLLTPFEAGYRGVSPGKPERWHLAAAKPELLPDGTVRAHGFATDITNQRRIEQLRVAESLRYRTLLSTATDGIHLLDIEGRLVESNEAFRRHLGYTAEEAAGLRVTDWNREGPPGELVQRLQAYRDRSAVFETRHLRKDGTVCEVELSVTGLDLGGRQLFFCASRDLTERKRAEAERRQFEEQLQQGQRLESLGVLAGGIAHDFNNLLTAILGNADLAAFDLPEGSPTQEPLREIVRASRRAADLCRQMLAYAGREKIVVAPLALPGLVEEMTQMLRVSIGKKIAFRHEFAAGLPLVEADASQLRQVVMNLVLNAAEAVGDTEGVIAVRIRTVSVAPENREHDWLGATLQPGWYVCLEVVDTGCGMAPETLQRIFEPFFTTKFTGRGLGLSAVLGIVRSHRGALRVESELGRGTTFRVLLPARAAGGVPTVRETVPVAGWRGTGCVLLVDDEETVRRLGRRMLERLGFTVETAESGDEALWRVDAPGAAFVCIILDLSMPGLDGAGVLAALQVRGNRVPVLLSSGYGASEVAERFADRGIAGVLPKPYELAKMTERLRAVCAPG